MSSPPATFPDMTELEQSRGAAGTEDDWSLGRFVHDQTAIVSVGLSTIVVLTTVLIPQPRTPNELVIWLGLGVGLLSLAASVARLVSHRHLRWSGEEIRSWLPAGDDEWARDVRDRSRRKQQAQLASRSGYDYLGKLLALDAAIFALITTGLHILGLRLG